MIEKNKFLSNVDLEEELETESSIVANRWSFGDLYECEGGNSPAPLWPRVLRAPPAELVGPKERMRDIDGVGYSYSRFLGLGV